MMIKFSAARASALSLGLGLSLLTLISFSACDEVNEALGIGDGKNHCQAICEWAAGCHAEARPVNADELAAECYERLKAATDSCEDSVQAAASEECGAQVDARAAEADSCGPFTGDVATRAIGVMELPAECGALGTDAIDSFDEAASFTEEPGDELCDRLNESICDRTTECLGELVPEEVIEAAGDLKATCLDTISDLAERCSEQSLYEASSAAEPNPTREFAINCVADFSEIECSDIFSGALPASCAGAFTNADDSVALASGLLDLGCGIEGVGDSIPCPE